MTVTVGDLQAPATITADPKRPGYINLAGPINGHLTTEQVLSMANAIQNMLKGTA